MKKQILNFCLEKGYLIDSNILNLFEDVFGKDIESVKFIIEKTFEISHKKILTKDVFEENKSKLMPLFLDISNKDPQKIKKLKLGLSIEITADEIPEQEVKVLSNFFEPTKKIEIGDFVNYFKNRFLELRNILRQSPRLDNLVSIKNISFCKSSFSIIGMVKNKVVTRNNNIILEVEDLTGSLKVLINKSKKELLEIGKNICLDSVLGFKGFGNKEILFTKEIIYPDAMLEKRKKSSEKEYAMFIGDLHFGSKKFLAESFLRFIDYLNGKFSNGIDIEKIKYLFIVGDIVTGIGNYPNQQEDLEIQDLEEQFYGLSQLLSKIPKHIKIIICPGNHDGIRLMEPQPIFDKKFAWPLYDLENVIVVNNPSLVNICSKKDFSGFNVLMYHGFSFPFYADEIPFLISKKAMNVPTEIMKYLLKNRHLAPTHGSTQYYPFKEDRLLIKQVPDIFVAAHTHKSDISYYNNILLVSVSCWEGLTPYQEKFGNEPDHCKVPLLDLKTREIKILDFEKK